MQNINLVCDYVIARMAAARADLNNIKLQKLMYYIQAWHLAFFGRALFRGRFQAWVHGPVNRELYDRFAINKSLYSDIALEDAQERANFAGLSAEERSHIDNILETYAKFSGTQLEEMTHQEDPWVQARHGFGDAQRCEVEIDEQLMRQYYASKL